MHGCLVDLPSPAFTFTLALALALAAASLLSPGACLSRVHNGARADPSMAGYPLRDNGHQS